MLKEQWITDAENAVQQCAEFALDLIEQCASDNDVEFDWAFELFLKRLRNMKEDRANGG